VKGGDALELLSTPATIVLDKTGTLTEGVTALTAWHGPDWVKPLIVNLERGSSHPLAEGFRRAWPDVERLFVTETDHVVGGGIEGVIDGRFIRVGSPRFVAAVTTRHAPASRDAATSMDRSLSPVHVAVDGELVAVAGFGDVIRRDARESLEVLRARGWRTVMLSGDAQEVALSVAAQLGFDAADVIAEASPEQKLAVVESLKSAGHRVVMVGDGVNDAAAIAAANVGVGVHGGAEACLSTADVYLTRPGLLPLVELIAGARSTMRVIRRNMYFSLGYNVIGIGFAIAGVLTPLVAAVMMPLSSMTVILGSWYGESFTRTRR
jgi:Cu2+-exporting ATPase